ncbi:MAG: hypothetical protein COB26_02415 [Piscirickettsiaceae bacterium]|nr:MAG: hypothetical protein COB26_02415 [Piscirickettsiaceae bacterium]
MHWLRRLIQCLMSSDKLNRAVERLNVILPIVRAQKACSPEIKQLHRDFLWSFVRQEKSIALQQLAFQKGGGPEAIKVLIKNGMVTVDANGDLTGAYPFSVGEREHVVEVNGHKVYAMCALDALAIAPMFQEATCIISRCHLTAEPLKIHMLADNIQHLDKVLNVRFGIAWDAMDASLSCADSLCREMVFLRDHQVAQKWLADDSMDREVFTLEEAVEFANRFFSPLLAEDVE